jgi:hypothetical protein
VGLSLPSFSDASTGENKINCKQQVLEIMKDVRGFHCSSPAAKSAIDDGKDAPHFAEQNDVTLQQLQVLSTVGRSRSHATLSN